MSQGIPAPHVCTDKGIDTPGEGKAMANVKRQALLSTLREFGGQANCIVVPRAFVKFTGSLESAMLFSQLLYWSEKNGSNRVYNTDAEFQEELSLSRRAVRQAKSDLERKGLIKTEVHRANGSPTTHYYLQEDEIEKQWSDWIVPNGTMESPKWDNPKSQVKQSLTETSTETSTNRAAKTAAPSIQGGSVDYEEKLDRALGDKSAKGKTYPPRTSLGKYLAENVSYGNKKWGGFTSAAQRKEWERLERERYDDLKWAIDWAIPKSMPAMKLAANIITAAYKRKPDAKKETPKEVIFTKDGGFYV